MVINCIFIAKKVLSYCFLRLLELREYEKYFDNLTFNYKNQKKFPLS